MMQPSLDIPRPLSADNETVSTALETAALFGSKGDALEAMRWLRRAAESAGEAGDDVRALALSRTAADLSEELQRDQVATPNPPPLPRAASVPRLPSVPPSVPRPSAAPPSVRASYPTPPSSRPGHAATLSRPPAAPSTAPAAAAAGPPRATRVSIQRSPTVAGVFEMRVLGDGEAARSGDGEGEGFLVMVDPQSTLLSS